MRRADGGEEMVFKGLETVRTDWSPLAQRFQQELYLRIFNRQPYQDYVRDYVRRTLAGELDDLLVYRKRLRRRLDDYQRNVPPHVRAARIADDYNLERGRPRQVPGRRLDQLRDQRRRSRAARGAAFGHRLRALRGQAVAAGGRRHPAVRRR